jgi:uncharacterized protein (TIRG00374 family)
VNRRTLATTAAGFAGAAVVLAVLAWLVGAGEVLVALSRADPAGVAAVAGAIVAWLCLWGLALRAVLAAVGGAVSRRDAVLVHAGAAFGNHVTPFGQAGGEPVAAWLLADAAEEPYERALAAVTSFDALNVVPSLSLAALGVGYYALTGSLGPRLRLVGGAVLAALVAAPLAGAVVWRHRAAAEALLVRVAVPPLRVLARAVPLVAAPTGEDLTAAVEEYAASVGRVARDRRRVAVALGFSTAGWVVQAAGLWVALAALGEPVPLQVPLFVVPLGTAASALPTPGGLGGIETLQVGLLVAATAVPAPTAAAAVAVFSVGGFLLTTSLGAAAAAALRVRGRVDG